MSAASYVALDTTYDPLRLFTYLSIMINISKGIAAYEDQYNDSKVHGNITQSGYIVTWVAALFMLSQACAAVGIFFFDHNHFTLANYDLQLIFWIALGAFILFQRFAVMGALNLYARNTPTYSFLATSASAVALIVAILSSEWTAVDVMMVILLGIWVAANVSLTRITFVLRDGLATIQHNRTNSRSAWDNRYNDQEQKPLAREYSTNKEASDEGDIGVMQTVSHSRHSQSYSQHYLKPSDTPAYI